MDARIRLRSQKFMYDRFHNMATIITNGKLTFKNCICTFAKILLHEKCRNPFHFGYLRKWR